MDYHNNELVHPPRAPSGLFTHCQGRHLLVGAPTGLLPLLHPFPSLTGGLFSASYSFPSRYPNQDKARQAPGERWEEPGGGVALSSDSFVHGNHVCFIDGYTHRKGEKNPQL